MLSLLLNSISLAVAIAFPTVTTYKALNSGNSDQTRALTIYWLVLAGVSIAESQLYFVLKYLPLYSFIKLYISLWLVLPNTKGAEYIYYNVVDPFLTQNLGSFENWLNDFKPSDFVSSLLVKITNGAFGPKEQGATVDKQKRNILDQFIGQVYKDYSDSRTKVDDNLLNSLIGVLQVLPFNADEKASAAGSLPDSQTAKADSVTSEQSNNENDFDVVNTKDIEDFKIDDKEEVVKVESHAGWFSFWGSQPKAKSA